MNKNNIEFILDLLEDLKKNNVRLFFLDYDRWKDSKDIDICLNKKDVKKFHKILSKKGFKLLSFFFPWKLFYIKYQDGDIILFDVHLGKYEGVSESILFPNSLEYFLDANKQLFYYIYRISLGQPHRKYEKYIKKLFNQFDEDVLLKYFEQYFTNASEIVQNLKKGHIYNIKPKHNIKHNLIRLFYYVRNKLFKTFGRFKKIFFPAPHVVVLGTDGSGKSTTVKELQKIFENSKFKLYYEYGGRYSFVCLRFMNIFIKRMIDKKIHESYNKSEKSELSEKDNNEVIINYKSKLIGLGSPFVYYIEYLLRTLCLYPKRLKYSMVLSDRWFYDLITSPNASNKIVSFLIKLFPKPSLLIYLYNDVDVLRKRRPEHPKEDLERQLSRFEKIEDIFDLRIKAENKEKVINEVIGKIIDII